MITDDVKKSTEVTRPHVLEQYLHNKKRRTNKEHQCGADQIPSECQVRTSHNSRVPELGWIMHILVIESIGAFIEVEG